MRIDSNLLNRTRLGQTDGTGSVGESSNGRSERVGSSVHSDTASISTLANLYAGVMESTSKERADLVSQLTEKVRSGTYSVDAHRLANALIDNAF